ncbi:MAG: GNAT family N-acetyltransferase [Alphaproteobacteria bacterium]|nr:GNAT family N-acetyltransferase [Alphaproteobacteria bacterium]MDE2264466.1 GNAT family N-acetyltransferase [Alphaproteobacteria bacterium]
MIFRIERANSTTAQKMIAALDAELLERYPAESIYGIEAEKFEVTGGVFVIGYDDNAPVVCGALRPYKTAIEIKRMYVIPSHRGRGLARRMLDFLEAEAVKRRYSHAVLETGTRQPEAISLYRSCGWMEIERFGPYVNEPTSVCFEKRLAATTQS